MAGRCPKLITNVCCAATQSGRVNFKVNECKKEGKGGNDVINPSLDG